MWASGSLCRQKSLWQDARDRCLGGAVHTSSGAWNLGSPWSSMSHAGHCALEGTVTRWHKHSSHCPPGSGQAKHQGFHGLKSFSLYHSRVWIRL